ncbi:MAG: hypothetical protein R6X02_26740 [Enhygromyxa sp.]
MPGQIDIHSPPDDLDKLFESSKAKLEAFNMRLAVRRTVTRARVLELTDRMLDSWAPMVSWIEQVFAPEYAAQRKAELERLDTRAWVFYAADLAAEEQSANTSRKARLALAQTVAEHDRFLFKWATPFFGDDPEHQQTLRDISRGTGSRDDAEDVVRLVQLFRANWKQIEGKQKMVTEDHLARAMADATRQIDLLRNDEGNPARKLADAAYSLWYLDYDEAMQLGRYLVRREPDAIQRFPGVRPLVTRTTKGDATGEQEVGEQEPSGGEQEPSGGGQEPSGGEPPGQD